jgi:ketosteroid isomerase-like protein
METEAAFARTMADRDHQAFSGFIADNAVFFAGNEPLRGKQRVIAWWARYFTDPGAPFSWEPAEVEILDSGKLAHSSGPVRDSTGTIIGEFSSLWRYEQGTWKIIFDKGSDVCDCNAP